MTDSPDPPKAKPHALPVDPEVAFVVIPHLSPTHASSAAQIAPPASDGTPTRVLLVDDSEDALESLQMLLELSGLQVTTAAGGAAALAASERGTFDVIVSDVGMPGMDGYQLMRELRRRPATARVPGIALTGYGRDEDRETAFAAGFQAHVDKPVDGLHLMDLIAGVRGALESR